MSAQGWNVGVEPGSRRQAAIAGVASLSAVLSVSAVSLVIDSGDGDARTWFWLTVTTMGALVLVGVWTALHRSTHAIGIALVAGVAMGLLLHVVFLAYVATGVA